MYDIIIANQELIISGLALVLTWLIALIWKKTVDKSKLVSILMMILDIAQDVKNRNPEATDEQKKKLSVAKVENLLAPKKLNLVKKVFGTVGAGVEFVWKNRKILMTAIPVLLKKVF